MAFKIVWTKRAVKKFEEIVEYLTKKWSSKVADKFVDTTFKTLDTLENYPEIGSLEVPERNIRGLLLHRKVRLFYKFLKNKITLLNFFHTQQDSNRKFK